MAPLHVGGDFVRRPYVRDPQRTNASPMDSRGNMHALARSSAWPRPSEGSPYGPCGKPRTEGFSARPSDAGRVGQGTRRVGDIISETVQQSEMLCEESKEVWLRTASGEVVPRQ